jgi:hypothetical protein
MTITRPVSICWRMDRRESAFSCWFMTMRFLWYDFEQAGGAPQIQHTDAAILGAEGLHRP